MALEPTQPTESQKAWKPYKRQSHEKNHHECPNCLASVHEAEMMPITYGTIVKHLKRENRKQKQAVREASSAFDGRLEALGGLMKHDQHWMVLPPVVKKLGRPLAELEHSGSLLAKSTNVCAQCYDSLADEVSAVATHSPAATTAKRSHNKRSVDAKDAGGQSSAWLGRARDSDRATDFVFSSLQEGLRASDVELRRKEKAKVALVRQNPDIDWETIPAPNVAIGKEFRALAKECNDGHDGLALIEAVPTSSPAALVEDDVAFTDPVIQAAGSNEDGVSVFDIPVSHWFMFELWHQVNAVSCYGATSDFDDVPQGDAFYSVYHNNKNRLPDPPVKDVYTPWLAPVGEKPSPMSLTPTRHAMMSRRRKQAEDDDEVLTPAQVLEKGSSVIATLTDIEKRELSRIMKDVDLGEPDDENQQLAGSVELSPFLFGERSGSDAFGSGRDEDFIEEDEEDDGDPFDYDDME